MPRGQPSPKLAITVDPDVHALVIAAAAGEGLSVSAWMTNAARRVLIVHDGLLAVAEWEAEQGALSEVGTGRCSPPRRRAGSSRGLASSPVKAGVSVVYDTGVLVAADRSDRELWPTTGHAASSGSYRSRPHRWSPKPAAQRDRSNSEVPPRLRSSLLC